MTVIIRSSCFLSCPCSRRFPPPNQFARRSGKSRSLLPYKEKLVLAFRCVNGEGSTIRSLFPGSRSTQQMLQHPNSEENLVVSHVSRLHSEIFERLSSLQDFKQLKFPFVTFLFTNALMFTAPFEAMAETCETNKSMFTMPLLLSVALIGATVGGLVARQRKGELQRVNEQLRQINAALKRQAKIESYAPALSYAPAGSRIAEQEIVVDPRNEELISKLRTGKNFLRNQEPEKAYVEFKAALDLARNVRDSTEEKKAARGLGASMQRQGKYREAIKYHSLVLDISEREREDSGNTEAYGAIADCYTELGDFEKAGQFYDKYISRLEQD